MPESANRSLKRYWDRYGRSALGLLLVLLLGLGAYGLGRALRPGPALAGTALQNPVAVGDLVLQGREGEQALSSFAGRYLLVFFGYTRCPDVCPLTLARLAAVYAGVAEPQRLQVLMISVDSEHATPEAVARYAASCHPSFLGLSGSNPQVAEAAKTFYIGFREAGPEVVHSDAVILVDPEGFMRVVYSQASLPDLRRDLERLL